MKTVVIIPARYASARLPAKPLAIIGGKTMIERTYTQAIKSRLASKVIVATDDERIYCEVERFGGNVMMTSKEHPTGSDRLVEVAKSIDADFYINVQGDEPFVDPADIDSVIEILQSNRSAQISTLCYPISAKEALDPNSVKVVFAHDKKALYFSRSPIPFNRDGAEVTYYKHMGLYGYTKEALFAYSSLNSSDLENSEKLEQLRYLQAGFSIFLAITKKSAPAIDTPSDLIKAEAYLRGEMVDEMDLNKIKLFITDIDGVLSPAHLLYGENGEELKAFNVRDGLSLRVLMATGVKVAVVSGRDSKVLRKRISDLKIDRYLVNIKDKKEACNQLMSELDLSANECAFVGDDTLDLPAFEACGVSFAVKDAPEYIRSKASIVLSKNGGDGAIREAVEMILTAQNNLHLLSTSDGYRTVMERVTQ